MPGLRVIACWPDQNLCLSVQLIAWHSASELVLIVCVCWLSSGSGPAAAAGAVRDVLCVEARVFASHAASLQDAFCYSPLPCCFCGIHPYQLKCLQQQINQRRPPLPTPRATAGRAAPVNLSRPGMRRPRLPLPRPLLPG